ncbi:MAG: NAD-dependent epimerase/dehydratase family protein [Terriglobia bacterium]|jgi:nucleoside-diphosphate-sugar epimerase
MKARPILVTGGCGFVGRHVVKYLLSRHISDSVWIVDNLFTGKPPEQWLPRDFSLAQGAGPYKTYTCKGVIVTFVNQDLRDFLRSYLDRPHDGSLPRFGDVIHLASIVGGRSMIDGDPLLVATDLSIDAEMFCWARVVKPDRVLYASSSAAYPIRLQGTVGSVALREEEIRFESELGVPDMTYGWSKLTGEYLARIASRHYGLHVACVRPFSGYGEDQEPVYPVPAIAQRVARKEDPLVVWGTGQQARDFIHIDDCVEFMFLVLDRVSDGSGVNIGSGVLATFLEVARLLSDIAGYAPSVKPLLDKPVGVQNRYADIRLMREEFHWSPRIPLREGLQRVYEAALESVDRTGDTRTS